MRQYGSVFVCRCSPQTVVCSVTGVALHVRTYFSFEFCFVPLPYNLWLLLFLLLLLSCCSHEILEKNSQYLLFVLVSVERKLLFHSSAFSNAKRKNLKLCAVTQFTVISCLPYFAMIFSCVHVCLWPYLCIDLDVAWFGRISNYFEQIFKIVVTIFYYIYDKNDIHNKETGCPMGYRDKF